MSTARWPPPNPAPPPQLFIPLFVPVEAIFNESGKTVAYVKHGRKARQITVDCGTSNDKYVIIRGGLQPGDKVFLGQPS